MLLFKGQLIILLINLRSVLVYTPEVGGVILPAVTQYYTLGIILALHYIHGNAVIPWYVSYASDVFVYRNICYFVNFYCAKRSSGSN
jgi:hypothetical protein